MCHSSARRPYFWGTFQRCFYRMKWRIIAAAVGGLYLSQLVVSGAQAQPQHQVAPTEGMATMEGSIQDGQTKTPIAGAIVVAKTQAGIVRAQQVTATDGVYRFKLDPKQPYIISVKADGYAHLEEQFLFTEGRVSSVQRRPTLLYRDRGTPPPANTITQTPVHQTATRIVEVPAKVPSPVATPPVSEQPAAGNAGTARAGRVVPPKTLDAKVSYIPPPIVATAGKTTELRALQFVQSKTELLPEAQPVLEQLLTFMRDHPSTEIELAGHTDNQGNFDENVKLSKERVEVVKAFLVQNGIAANRISTRGFGPTRPIASNNSEATRKLNRRVEMTVLKE